MQYTYFLIFIFPAIYVIYTYNKLISKNNLAQEAWSGIDIQLKRRHELLPNLVEMVKGYASHEQEVLINVTQARSQSEVTTSIGSKGEIENTIRSDITKIIALAEAYPELKANSSFLKLQTDLSEIENTLQYARRYYNGTVREYENLRQIFPANVISNWFKFDPREYFQLGNREIESAATKIKFTNE